MIQWNGASEMSETASGSRYYLFLYIYVNFTCTCYKCEFSLIPHGSLSCIVDNKAFILIDRALRTAAVCVLTGSMWC